MPTNQPDLTAYLLLHLIRCAECRAPMAPAVRGETRLYRCIGPCGKEIDARHAENLMWNRVAKRHPEMVWADMPDDQRREVLTTVLRIVRGHGPSNLLTLRATWVEPLPVNRETDDSDRGRRGSR